MGDGGRRNFKEGPAVFGGVCFPCLALKCRSFFQVLRCTRINITLGSLRGPPLQQSAAMNGARSMLRYRPFVSRIHCYGMSMSASRRYCRKTRKSDDTENLAKVDF